MQYTGHYQSPLGEMFLAADEDGLTGLWFAGQKCFAASLGTHEERENLPVFAETRRWLDVYFSGREPDFTPPLNVSGTPFRRAVWDILLRIPYGRTVTYGDIARELAAQRGGRMSAQAVGGAVGHNPVSVIIPCHRVVGSGGSLTGYAGGIGLKLRLLQIEGADASHLLLP